MRYWTLLILGFLIFAGSIYLFTDALTELLDTGTCASGNTPYVIAKQCPDGTGANILMLVGSVFGLMLAAIVFALRGDRPGGGTGIGGSPFVAGWGIFFSVTGAVSLLHSVGSDTIPADGKLDGIIVGATFLLMGLPALVYWVWSVVMDLGGDEHPSGMAAATGFSVADPRASAPARFAAASGGGDRIAELERLQRLRESGALTAAEFEREKARILRG
ncbi:MAG: SHOCT domain-containing protein [Solirubrobacterales bacterium]